MRVLVTGATGFLGSHTVSALRASGHEVRALVRDPSRLAPAFALHGLDATAVETVRGDMTEPAVVAEAVSGCDAVVHAAALYSYDPRDAAAMLTTNAAGARTVLGAAADAGATSIVHVSSVVAIAVRRPGTRLRADAGPGTMTGPYSRSKRASDEEALRLQRAGAPVVRFLPGAIIGPRDPYVGETNRALVNVLRGRPPAFPTGTLPYCDVRSCAEVIVGLAERGSHRQALLAPVDDVDGADVLRAVTRRRLPLLRMPPAPMHAAMGPLDPLVARLPRSVPAMPREAVEIVACGNTFDDESAFTELGVTRPPIHDVFRDAVRWFHGTGRITAKQAGAALG